MCRTQYIVSKYIYIYIYAYIYMHTICLLNQISSKLSIIGSTLVSLFFICPYKKVTGFCHPPRKHSDFIRSHNRWPATSAWNSTTPREFPPEKWHSADDDDDDDDRDDDNNAIPLYEVQVYMFISMFVCICICVYVFLYIHVNIKCS